MGIIERPREFFSKFSKTFENKLKVKNPEEKPYQNIVGNGDNACNQLLGKISYNYCQFCRAFGNILTI